MGVEFSSGKKEFQDADVIPNLRNKLGLEVEFTKFCPYHYDAQCTEGPCYRLLLLTEFWCERFERNL